MNKTKFIIIISILLLTMSAAVVSTGFIISDYCIKTEKEKKTTITFDSDGGEYIYPWECFNSYDLTFLPRTSKPGHGFLGWTYEGKFVDEIDKDTFKCKKEIVLVAKWKEVDSVEMSKIENSILSYNENIKSVSVTVSKSGYEVSVFLDGIQFVKWYNAGIASLELAFNLSENSPEYYSMINKLNFVFTNGFDYCFAGEYNALPETRQEKLTKLTNNFGDSVSLLTLSEYRLAKEELEAE